ncbi:uncharacterized protein [Aegilops tauschii subsp. strangulata]|uniref:uncharacterized protein n=1 Tax=Aegilops tauschii subsp. strangulata TaxID=200361 RepID=UPI003CC8CF1E
MADDRAEPLRDPEAERYLMGIINNKIPYVPGSEYEQEEDVVSSFLNLDGDQEGDNQEGEGTDIVDGGQPSTNDDLELQVATTSGEPSAGSSTTKRGKSKAMKTGETYAIEFVSETGKPLQHTSKFINQCGVVVRDNVPITVQEWKEPKKARLGFSFVDKRTKKDCWRKLMEHFILPPEYNKVDEFGNEVPGGRERRRLVKEFALQKMGEAFRNFKKNLTRDYVNKGKTPDFNGQHEKLKDDWLEFVRQKQSEHFKEISKKNKDNASKKKFHHIMGPGGYRLSEPRWQKMEEDLRVRGIPLGTEGWDSRAKSWWYGHGGSLDPETGVCVHRQKKFAPTQALIDAMTQAQEGLIKFNREKDALTTALGNDEHGGRVRGKGKVPWKVGFSQDNDPYCYRSRKRKTDRDADLMAKFASELHELKQTVHELVKEKSAAGPHEDHEADRGSQQRRSSVASTDAPPGASAPMIEIRAPEPHYPVDDLLSFKILF